MSDDLRAVQEPLKRRYREDPDAARITLHADGDLDFRGTLAVDKQTPVGFHDIRLRFDLTTDADEAQVDTLMRLTERYCVVFQTLANPPRLAVTRTSRS